MLKSFLPYIKCIIPLISGALFVLGFMFTQRMIAATIITRPIPTGGFASVEEEIRYVNDQPAETRRHMKYRAWIIFAVAACILMPLSYFVPMMILKVVLK